LSLQAQPQEVWLQEVLVLYVTLASPSVVLRTSNKLWDFLGLNSKSSFLEASRDHYVGGPKMDDEKGQGHAGPSELRNF
jgi:hypothetical protein